MNDPKPMGISLSDHLAGIFACYGILGALMARSRTGRGQHVETSLLESSIAFLAENAANFFEGTGTSPTRATRTRQAQVFTFVAKDDLPFVVHLSSPPKFWTGLVTAVDLPALATDERFATRSARTKYYDPLREQLQTAFRTRTRAEWLEKLRENDVPCGPMNTFAEVFDDPQVKLLEMERTLPHPKRGSVRVVGSPIRLSDTPVQIVTSAPELGADNDAFSGSRRR
jgi:formyl-CoA transferase